MIGQHKKTLKALVLDLRHLLEGTYNGNGKWQAGDLEQRLAAIGVRRDRDPIPADELPHLGPEDRKAREIVDAYLALRREAWISYAEAIAEFVRETAYTWANRLLALRCMEARELIDEVILQKEVYGGRSLEHHRLAQRRPELCTGEDDGLFAALDKVFAEQSKRLPLLFDPKAPGIVLRPSPAAMKRCIALLSGKETVKNQEPASDDLFKAPDALGWAYQYWNTEEKDRVFERVRTQKGAKVEGADIIPATQLYTEPYMVKFLVQNSLGAIWMEMHPESRLKEDWEYFVLRADRAPIEKRPVQEISFFDPACGSGHFLLEAFDLFYAMYEEEGARAWGLGTREKRGGDEELQGTESVAGRNGAGCGGASDVRAFSERGGLRTEEPDSTSGSVNSIEHRGRTCSGFDAGVPEVHLHCTGLPGGTGNSAASCSAIQLSEGGIAFGNHKEDRRDRQDASGTAESAEKEASGWGLEAGEDLRAPSPPSLAPSTICRSILEKNLFGIDIDERAIQIAAAALWMKAASSAIEAGDHSLTPGPQPLTPNLVASNIRLPKGKDHLKEFLAKNPQDSQLRPSLEVILDGMEHADELGSLLQIEKPVDTELQHLKSHHDALQSKAEIVQREMFKPTVIQERLPFGIESYKEWKQKTLAALKDHFATESESADLVQSFFGRSAGRSLLLLDLLARRYDVVAANPPYMGSKNMGPVLKKYVERHYPLGKRDLYAAFILRCLELAADRGRVAMVTQQSWMFLRSFADLRAAEDPDASFQGLLRETTIEALAHLGPGAFGEISGEVVNTVLFSLTKAAPSSDHRVTAFRLIGPKSPEEKDRLLRQALNSINNGNSSRSGS